ncbi:uncharacterized protein LOC133191490 [Saccostrea echinata]|uniref:uncharacterized protein LOC133191490 n=1 Tax=Saccostrea echinata TaxID=191078 RepID=UPI002A83C910|nr:uncharacterized protein LOC133191490 [Saccostrea echinata]
MKIKQLIPSNFFQKSKRRRKSEKNKDNSKDTKHFTDHVKHADFSVQSRENSISNLIDIDSDLDSLFKTLRSRANQTHATQQTLDSDFDSLQPEKLSFEDKEKCNSLKQRTRIRTNPWIQLPVAEVASELCVCQSKADDTFTVNKEFGDQTEYSFFERLISQNISELKATCKQETLQNNLEIISEIQTRSKGTDIETRYRWSIISEGDISIDWSCEAFCECYSNDSKNGNVTYDAQYENDLDLILEQGISERDFTKVSMEDLLNDSDCNRQSNEKKNFNTTALEDNSENSSESSYQLTDIGQINEMSIMQESLDAGYASLTRDGTLSTDEEEKNESRMTDSYWRDFSTTEATETSTELNCFMDSTPSGRTLPEVKESLQEKINQLRLEKLIVQNKIREAKEEERSRMEQRRLLQGKYPAERKLSLFKTLIDLKQRLENQTLRIQRSYSTVLIMQKNFSRQKSPVLCVPTHVTL